MPAQAVVTGASKGIGRAIAKRLAERYEIVAVARSKGELGSLEREIREAGGACRAVPLDVGDERAVSRELGGVEAEVLVNNAGVMTTKRFLDLSPEEWRHMMSVNVDGVANVTRAILPGMVQRRHGFVVNIGSLAGRNPFAGGTAYTATKHALIGFTESLMLEVRDANVRVAIVMPGSVATELTPGGSAGDWKLRPEDVAEAVWYVINQPDHALVSRVEMRPLKTGRSS